MHLQVSQAVSYWYFWIWPNKDPLGLSPLYIICLENKDVCVSLEESVSASEELKGVICHMTLGIVEMAWCGHTL